jgi:hypothetical protein
MKTLLTSTALVAMLATGAMANQTDTVDWEGNTDDLTAGCSFIANTNGTMKYTETLSGTTLTGVWTTDNAADVTIVVRQDAADANNNTTGVTVVPVKADGTTPGETIFQVDNSGAFVGGTEVAATIDYTATGNASSVVLKPTGWNESIAATEVKVNNTGNSGVIDLDIAGTATLDAGVVADANGDYRVRHLITCFNNGNSTIGDYTAP